MAVIRVCALCESSCTEDHKYNIARNKELYVCNGCWEIVRALFKEFSKKGK